MNSNTVSTISQMVLFFGRSIICNSSTEMGDCQASGLVTRHKNMLRLSTMLTELLVPPTPMNQNGVCGRSEASLHVSLLSLVEKR